MFGIVFRLEGLAFVGCPWWCLVLVTSYVAMLCIKGPPLQMDVFDYNHRGEGG